MRRQIRISLDNRIVSEYDFCRARSYTLTGKNFKEDWIDSILFEAIDLFAREREMAGKKAASTDVKLEKGADGILRATRDIHFD